MKTLSKILSILSPRSLKPPQRRSFRKSGVGSSSEKSIALRTLRWSLLLQQRGFSDWVSSFSSLVLASFWVTPQPAKHRDSAGNPQTLLLSPEKRYPHREKFRYQSYLPALLHSSSLQQCKQDLPPAKNKSLAVNKHEFNIGSINVYSIIID